MIEIKKATIYYNPLTNQVMSEDNTACFQLFNEGACERRPENGEWLELRGDYGKWVLEYELRGNIKSDTLLSVIEVAKEENKVVDPIIASAKEYQDNKKNEVNVKKVLEKMYVDIDNVINDIVSQRLHHKDNQEMIAKNNFQMERVLVGMQQDITVLLDQLKLKKEE